MRRELLDASDEMIDDAVRYADPMALRGVLYQLTGDESVADVEVVSVMAGFTESATPAGPEVKRFLQAKAAEFLKAHRDGGAGELDIGPRDRLPRSMGLTVGHDIDPADVDMWIEQLAIDPWARGLQWSAPPDPDALAELSVIVIGAGAGGLGAAVQLQRAGIPFVVLEKNDGVGGTWYENRYPGARVDQPSRVYTYMFAIDFDHANPFCAQAENERYFNHVVDTFELHDHLRFRTEVIAATWDDVAQVWEVEIRGPGGTEVLRANAVISSVGFLSRPNLPDIEGMDTFTGRSFHTARWPQDLELAGKRVAVVGSGATGYQLVPELAKMVEHTYVFQRTPNWCFDTKGYLDPFPPQINWLDRNFPFLLNFIRLRLSWIYGPDGIGAAFTADPTFEDEHARSAMNKRIRDERVAFIRRKFADRPDLVEAMTPTAPPFSSRPVLVDSDDCIYDALLRDDVTLVTDAIQRIDPRGIELADGTLVDVDVIVFATGFRANDFLWPMQIRGRGGMELEELWGKDGARAYLGTMLPGFPNFFMIYGPNTNATGGLGIFEFEEMVTHFALECLAHLVLHGERTVEVTTDAYWNYNDELDRAEQRKIYCDPRAHNYYRNEHGRSAGNSPFDIRRMRAWLLHPEDHRTHPRPNLEHEVRPHFGEDLLTS